MGLTTAVGSAKAQGSKVKPAIQVRPAQSNRSEERSDRKGGQQLAHREPHRGDPTSSSIIFESRSGGFLHTPPCGQALSRSGFPAKDYPGKTLETTWSAFGWGALAPVWSYGEALALASSHPQMVTQAPLRS
jgi:hypothetical protein